MIVDLQRIMIRLAQKINPFRVTFLSPLLGLMTLLSFPSPATATGLSLETRTCLFAKAIAFGASVTQATTAMIPGYRGLVRGVEMYGDHFGEVSSSTLPKSSRPYGLSPIRYVTKALVGKQSLTNIEYIGSYVTNSLSQLGSAQIASLLQGEKRELYEKSRLIVGVDAFYWDAVWNRCATGDPLFQLHHLLESAKAKSKFLVLGNVPIENPELVRIASERTRVNNLWSPPNPACAEQINAALASKCTPENNCYLLNMKSMVDHLAGGGHVSVFGKGNYGYFDIRPDGVHLSDVGSRLVAEMILLALEEHPPQCS